jgi:glycerophosphoryl diester phosphodiesterase
MFPHFSSPVRLFSGKLFLPLLMSAVLMNFSCRKDPSLQEERPLSGGFPRVIGHAGMGIASKYPMDSFASLTECLSLGADGTEMDVHLSADSVLVLYHASDLKESTGCEGLIRDLRWDEMRGCLYKRPVLKDIIPLCSAEEFMEAVSEKERFIFTFECKIETDDSSEYVNRFARTLCRFLGKHGITKNAFIESYNLLFLEQLHQLDSTLQLFIYTRGVPSPGELKHMAPLRGITVDLHRITAEDVREAHRLGLEVTVFNARTGSDNAQALNTGADNIQTDRLEHLLELRSR